MTLDELDLEGTADWALTRSRVDLCAPVDPFEVARGLEIAVARTPLRGALAVMIGNDPPTIAVRPRISIRDAAFALAHELGHVAMLRTGTSFPHDENDADEIARRILVPRGWIRVECLTRGCAIEELPALCPFVDPRTVIVRARHVLGLGVAIDDAA